MDQPFAGLHVRHWVLENKTGNPSLQGSARAASGDGWIMSSCSSDAAAAAAALTVVYCWKGCSSYAVVWTPTQRSARSQMLIFHLP